MQELDKVVFKPLYKSALCPKRHSAGAAGYDLHTIAGGSVAPQTTLAINLGFCLRVPTGMFGYICGRSGHALKNGISVENSYVTNNSEVCVNLCNRSNVPFTFEKGDRIAQLFFAKVAVDATFKEEES